MKVRVGFGLGVSASSDGDGFAHVVDELERLRFDSLWLSERVGGPAPDPLVGMAFAAGRTKRMKFGMSVMVLPGRNPALLATELASLDQLSGGRLLPAFGLGAPEVNERQAFGVARQDRAAWCDEVIPLLHRMWSEDAVDHDGPLFHYEALSVLPKPRQPRLDVWLGGHTRGELVRAGRLADGWLPSFVTPQDVEEGRATIDRVAGEHDRAIDPEHYGVLVPYAPAPLPAAVSERLQARRPDVDLAEMVPSDLAGVERQVHRFIDAGASKFVLMPLVEPSDWTAHLEQVAAELLPLQN